MTDRILAGCSNTSLAQNESKGPWRDAADAAVSGGEVEMWAIPGETKWRNAFTAGVDDCGSALTLVLWQLCERTPGPPDLYAAAVEVLQWMRMLTADTPIYVCALPKFDPPRSDLVDCTDVCARLVADMLALPGPDFAAFTLTPDLLRTDGSAHTNGAGSRAVAAVLDAFEFAAPDPDPDPLPEPEPQPVILGHLVGALVLEDGTTLAVDGDVTVSPLGP